MASEPTDEMVEAAAEAAYEEHWRLRNSRDSRCPWAKLGPAKAPWLLEARAALTAALAALERTHVVVPKEANTAMIAAARRAEHDAKFPGKSPTEHTWTGTGAAVVAKMYRAMLAAATEDKP